MAAIKLDEFAYTYEGTADRLLLELDAIDEKTAAEQSPLTSTAYGNLAAEIRLLVVKAPSRSHGLKIRCWRRRCRMRGEEPPAEWSINNIRN